nr:uncharacterized protein LOC115266988 [Aedes albopictus]
MPECARNDAKRNAFCRAARARTVHALFLMRNSRVSCLFTSVILKVVIEMAEEKIEIEQLIGSVFLRKELWDQTSRGYRNRVLVDNSWKELAEEFNVSEDFLKKKWKNLRDKYGKILRNLPVSRSGDPGDEDNGTSWPFFKCMQFLKNQMKPRKTSGNLPKPQPKPLNDDNDDNDDHYGEIEMLDETAAEVMDSRVGLKCPMLPQPPEHRVPKMWHHHHSNGGRSRSTPNPHDCSRLNKRN